MCVRARACELEVNIPAHQLCRTTKSLLASFVSLNFLVNFLGRLTTVRHISWVCESNNFSGRSGVCSKASLYLHNRSNTVICTLSSFACTKIHVRNGENLGRDHDNVETRCCCLELTCLQSHSCTTETAVITKSPPNFVWIVKNQLWADCQFIVALWQWRVTKLRARKRQMRSFAKNEAGWSRRTEAFVFSSCWNTARTYRRIESELLPDVFIDLFNIPDSRPLIIIRSLSRQHSEWQELIVLGRQPSVRRRSRYNPQCNGRCLQRPLGQKLFTLMSKSKYSNVSRIRTGVVFSWYWQLFIEAPEAA